MPYIPLSGRAWPKCFEVIGRLRERPAEQVWRQGVCGDSVAASHVSGSQQRVENRFFRRFGHRGEQRGEPIVWQGTHLDDGRRAHAGQEILRRHRLACRGEGQEDVTAGVGSAAASPADADGSTLREAAALIAEDRRVGRDDDDDRPGARFKATAAA